MTNTVTALSGDLEKGRFGETGTAGVILQEVESFSILQIAAWPDTFTKVGKIAAKAAGVSKTPAPGEMMLGKTISLLRIEPLKFWLTSVNKSAVKAPKLEDKDGCLLDLSHSRAWVKVGGEKAETLLNHFMPIDFRPSSFSANCVVTTAFHHTGVTVWRDKNRFNLLLPRSFSVSLWEQLVESALQYGLEVK